MSGTLKMVISGGQTGADIAAVDAAIDHKFPYGGTLPKGRRQENGSVPVKYTQFSVSSEYNYLVRTEENVKNADGSVIFTNGRPSTGTAATINFAIKHKKPYVVIDVSPPSGFVPSMDPHVLILDLVKAHKIQILNVAGPRESKMPGIHKIVYDTISKVILAQ